MSNSNEPPSSDGAPPPQDLPELNATAAEMSAMAASQATRRQSAMLANAPQPQPAAMPNLPANALAPESGHGTEDLFRFAQLVWRHKILVFSLTLVFTLSGFLISQRVTPRYQSQQRLSVIYQAPPRNDWDPGVSDTEYQRNFESILREAVSRNVMLKAADKILEAQDVPSLKDLPRDAIADVLTACANIDSVKPTNHVIYSYTTPNRDEAKVVLGYLVKAFKEDQMQIQSQGYQHGQEDLWTDEINKRRDYDAAREAYNNFRFNNHIDDTDPTPYRYTQQMADLKKTLQDADIDLTLKTKLLSVADPSDDGQLLTWMAATTKYGYMMQQFEAELNDLKRQYNDRAQKYDEKDPEMQRLAAAIVSKREEMIKVAHNGYDQAKQELEAAQDTRNKAQTAIDDLQKKMDERLPLMAQLEWLKEQADVAGQNWKIVAERKLEASNASQQRYTKISNVEPITDAEQVYPRVGSFIIVGGVAGTILGILIILLWTRIDDTLKTSAQVPRELGIPTLGTVLFSPAIGPDPSGLPLVARMPRSPEAEALFIVWANISSRLNFQPESCRVLMLTSSIPEEGKSTTSANLAAIAAQQNMRVLLIDLDLRRPSLHSYYGVTNAVGCIQALSRHMRREQCVQRTAVKNLDILTTGLGEDHPNELVSPQNLMGLLAWARGNYDLVVLDTPPLLLAADGLIVSRFIDGAVLVIHGGQTPLDTVQRSRDMLVGAGANLIGAILNDRTGAADDHDRSYYYKYSSYYHQASANE